MSAYGPIISTRVFGAPDIERLLKLVFARSLIFSRLFFNTHTWAPKRAEIRVLNGPYMRFLRRISGEMSLAVWQSD